MEPEELRSQIMPCDWGELAPHFARGALLVVSNGLDMLDAALAIALDDAAAVQGLLDSGGLAKLAKPDADRFKDTGDARFQFIILQPYVLAQQLPKPDKKGSKKKSAGKKSGSKKSSKKAN